jgi:hypothetical protein
MIQEPNDNTPTIETVERQFEQWRSSRGKKREPIPQHLWHAAAQLCEIRVLPAGVLNFSRRTVLL